MCMGSYIEDWMLTFGDNTIVINECMPTAHFANYAAATAPTGSLAQRHMLRMQEAGTLEAKLPSVVREKAEASPPECDAVVSDHLSTVPSPLKFDVK